MPRHDLRMPRPLHDRAAGPCAASRWIPLFLLGMLAAGTGVVEASEARPRREKTPIPVKILRYAQRVVDKYDGNGDGRLDQDEWSQMAGNPRLADIDRDQVITAAELAERVAKYGRPRKIRLTPTLAGGDVVLPSLVSRATAAPNLNSSDRPNPPPSQAGGAAGQSVLAGSPSAKGRRGQDKRFASRTPLPRTLPGWFSARDANGDAQITMAEFVSQADQSQFDEFARYDHNGDGVITAEEGARGPKATGRPTRRSPQETVKETPEMTESEQSAAAEEAAALREERLEKLRAKKRKQTDKPAKKVRSQDAS